MRRSILTNDLPIMNGHFQMCSKKAALPWLMQCCIGTEQAFRGEICPSGPEISGWYIFVIRDGASPGCGHAFSRPCHRNADNEYMMIDSTIGRAHPHRSGAKGGLRKSKHRAQLERIEYKDPHHG